MSVLRVHLFGTFRVHYNEHTLAGLDAPKIQELFCYLLLHRVRLLSRDILADLLWSDSSTEQSKKYLRQGLWQLQTAMECCLPEDAQRLLTVEHDGIQINQTIPIWLDSEIFEQAFTQTKGIVGAHLDQQSASLLQDMVSLYQGDLLEGWYQDWCVYERERFQNMYFMILAKLMAYCEAHQEYETAISYGHLILRYDRANERTHQRLMCLYFWSGDRIAALRQYQRCVIALREEFDVEPAAQTCALYKLIHADKLPEPGIALPVSAPKQVADTTPITAALARLEQVSTVLVHLQQSVADDIQILRRAVGK